MKRVITFLMILVILLSLVGCSNEVGGIDSTSSNTITTKVPATTENTFNSPTVTIEPTETSDGTETNTASPEISIQPTASVTPSTSAPIVTKKPTSTSASSTPIAKTPSPTPIDTPEPTVGNVIKFGKYEQDNNTTNGKEDIEWIVLAKETGRILVISKYALDVQPYNTDAGDVTWETCSLRAWLNGTFINGAFSSSEKSKIPTVTVTAETNPVFDYVDAGNDTQDKVYLLGISEANTYFASNDDRKCSATQYVIAKDGYIFSGVSYWRLRTPGSWQGAATFVDNNGIVVNEDGQFNGFYVESPYMPVRPAMWITLD